MASSCCKISPIIPIFVGFLLVASSLSPAVVSTSTASLQDDKTQLRTNQTFKQTGEELQKLKRIRAHLSKINKPAVKTIQSPDGDLIDCVLLHQQPAFDHPELKGQKTLDPPVRPKGHSLPDSMVPEGFQLWTNSGESCPDGTIPIRRTKEEDMLRASSIERFGRKLNSSIKASSNVDHEYAVGFVLVDKYFGAKAVLNVWAPQVAVRNEFSLAQIWVIAGTTDTDLNAIETGWQVNPALFGDNHPRLFIYWTADGYGETGCYNLLCSGFVQTNNKIAIGGAISPLSSFNGGQSEISLMVWKDPKSGNWWLGFDSDIVVGYWPSVLFPLLKNHSSIVQFGGEITNQKPSGVHTSTKMGSGHFAEEGFKKSAYIRNIEVVTRNNNLVTPSNFQVLADHPNCYDVQEGFNNVWNKYFYYGGPGKNPKCL